MSVPHRRQSSVFVAALGLLAVAHVLATIGGTYSLPLLGLLGCLVVAGGSLFYPRLALYLLVVSTVFGRLPVTIGNVQLRPDQLVLAPIFLGVAPRLAAAALRPGGAVIWSRRSRMARVVSIGLCLYVLMNLISSGLYSPQFGESLRIVGWLLLSLVAFFLTYAGVGTYISVREATLAILGTGLLSAVIGIGLYVAYQVTGFDFGVQVGSGFIHDGSDMKATGTFHEANIFGSFHAFLTLLGMTVLSSKDLRAGAARWVGLATVLSFIAVVLSFSRAAWLGLACGGLVIGLFRARGLARASGRFVLPSAVVLSFALLPSGLLQNVGSYVTSIGDLQTPTLAFRLVRFGMALTEWPTSPVLGLGTNSFGQRHLDPTQGNAPDYLPNLFLISLYDTGVVGLVLLTTVLGAIGFAMLALLRRQRGVPAGDLALGLLSGGVCLLVSYQATSAFWFSYNWIIMALALKLYSCASARERGEASGGRAAVSAARVPFRAANAPTSEAE